MCIDNWLTKNIDDKSLSMTALASVYMFLGPIMICLSVCMFFLHKKKCCVTGIPIMYRLLFDLTA